MVSRDGHWLRGGLARRSGAVDVVRAVQSYRQQISSCELCVGDSRNFVTKLCVELLELLEIGRVTRELEFWNSHFFLGSSTGEVEGEKRSKRGANEQLTTASYRLALTGSPRPHRRPHQSLPSESAGNRTFASSFITSGFAIEIIGCVAHGCNG